MNMNRFQSQKYSQNLSFYMMKFMEIFALPTEQLIHHLQVQLQNNPFLEESDDIIEEMNDETKDDKNDETEEIDLSSEKDNKDEVDWEEYFDNMDDNYYSQKNNDDKNLNYEKGDYFDVSLVDYLISQLHTLKLTKEEIFIGEVIIGNITEEGFFPYTINDTVIMAHNALRNNESWNIKEEEITLNKAEKILNMIHHFEPVGIAAKDVKDCLLIQLRYYNEEDTIEYKLIDQYFEDFQSKKYNFLVKKLKISLDRIMEAENRIKMLNPKPGLDFKNETNSEIIPDIIVDFIDGKLNLYVNDSGIPKLRINSFYKQLLKNNDKGIQQSKDFLKEKLNSAAWLIKSIDQRMSTMNKIANIIVKNQRDFFIKGTEYIKPMTLKDIAEQIDVHPTTVGRIVNSKYIQTPSGIYSLKYFFSSKVKNENGPEDHSSVEIISKISDLICNEDKKHPLSDNKIAKLLSNEGYSIARRTVTKYREKKGILPSRLRKKL